MEDKEYQAGVFKGEVMAKLDAIHGAINDIRNNTSALEARIRILENWRWWVMGAAAAIGGTSSVIASKIL